MKFSVNGSSVEANPTAGQVLSTVLRDLDHFDVKMGCGTGDCGACTVLLDGEPIHSCIYPAHRLEGAAITTVSGLGSPEHPHPLQQSFVEAAGFPCGFCTAGMIVTASTFTEDDHDDLPRLLKSNICRCTGYRSIRDAICGASNTQKPASGEAAWQSVRAPAGMKVATGEQEFTLDFRTTGLLHLAVLKSPHAHARILSIDPSRALAAEGVHAVLTHRDSPATLFSTGRHEMRTDDPDDTLVLDPVLRFIGQRVAAVVADTIAIAERALALIAVEYEVLRGVFDPELARSPCAPLLHSEKGEPQRVAAPERNVLALMHGETGDVDAAIAAADAVATGTWHTQRVNHAALETHATRGWLDADGRLVLRTSSQVPHLVRDELCRIFDLDPARLRVFTARVGAGFGGTQELVTEDLVTLAVLRTGRPVQYAFTREDEFTIASPGHPMRVAVTLAATSDGTLTAMAVDELTDTGAYGNHGIAVMHHSVHESMTVYRCANKRVDAESVYTNNLPSGAFRGNGLGQVVFAIESAMDELARTLGMDPFELRRRNIVMPGDEMVVVESPAESDLRYGSYGLDQCLDLVESALARFSPVQLDGPTWTIGTGMALAMIAALPPHGHCADATVTLLPDGAFGIGVGAVEFGTGPTTVQAQLVATSLGTTVDRAPALDSGAGVLEDGGMRVGSRLISAAEPRESSQLTASARHDGTPRSVAFTVHGFQVAVDCATGEVRILQSVQAADVGTVLNPEQLRGQIEGATAQAIGTALYEEIRLDGAGRVTTTAFRNYHVPRFADIPDTEVYFAESGDTLGLLDAKSMSEAPYNPVAPALANAIRDALGVRPHQLPMSRERLWRLVIPAVE